MLLYFFKPIQTVLESLLSRDVIGKEHTVSTSVEDSGNGTEGLLSGCVPDLQLYYFLLNLNYKCAELHTYCHLMLYFEIVVHNTCKKATLANTYL